MRLSLEDLMYLPDEHKDRYRNYEQGFDSPFWKDLKALAESEVVNAAQRGANADTWENNRIALGARLIWEYIAHMEDAIENEFRQYIDQQRIATQSRDEEIYE